MQSDNDAPGDLGNCYLEFRVHGGAACRKLLTSSKFNKPSEKDALRWVRFRWIPWLQQGRDNPAEESTGKLT